MGRTVWAVVVAAGVGLAAGCDSSKPAVSAEAERKAALEDLGQMLKSLAEEGRKPPAKPADLESVEPMIPLAGPAIRNGEVVYLWGAGYVSGGNQVVAHEKRVTSEGGFVLLQDGTVKQMTADEFKSAPKAK